MNHSEVKNTAVQRRIKSIGIEDYLESRLLYNVPRFLTTQLNANTHATRYIAGVLNIPAEWYVERRACLFASSSAGFGKLRNLRWYFEWMNRK